MFLNSLINILGQYNPFFKGHTLRVFFLNSLLVKKITLPPEEKELITAVAYLHSIGKIFSEPKALTKNEILNEKDEKTLMKRHTLDSVHILSNFGFDQSLIKIVLLHHERINGQGYPLSIKNKEISLGSKIIAIADSFDSLTLWRPYRNHLSIKEAQKELILNSNTQFDSFLLAVFFQSLGIINKKKTFIPLENDFPYLNGVLEKYFLKKEKETKNHSKRKFQSSPTLLCLYLDHYNHEVNFNFTSTTSRKDNLKSIFRYLN